MFKIPLSLFFVISLSLRMNNIRNAAMEIVSTDLIYA